MVPAVQQELMRGYAASITYMDEQLGRVIQALKANGFNDNTVVVLTSDHGYSVGDYNQVRQIVVLKLCLRANDI
jgi:arylsulfatase A-like enzyme